MDSFTCYAVASLVTFGISHSFANAAGPFGLCKWVRKRLEMAGRDWISEGIECPICWSFWIGMVVAFAMNGGVAMWLCGFGFTAAVMSLSPPE